MTGPEMSLTRHGATEWSASGRHTSWTDVSLTPSGEREALAVGRVLRPEHFDLVEASPRQRALRTAELAGFKPEIDDDLVEWDYGDLEGLTTAEESGSRTRVGAYGAVPGQAGRRPGKSQRGPTGSLNGCWPCRPGPGLLFSHGHLLRVLAARWLGQHPSAGRLLLLVTGTLSVLGWERDNRVIERWSVPCGMGNAGPGPG